MIGLGWVIGAVLGNLGGRITVGPLTIGVVVIIGVDLIGVVFRGIGFAGDGNGWELIGAGLGLGGILYNIIRFYYLPVSYLEEMHTFQLKQHQL